MFSLGGSLRAAVSRQNRRAGGEGVAAALGDVARAGHGRARAGGVNRDALYKALTRDGDPRLSTFLGVARALGLKIQVAG